MGVGMMMRLCSRTRLQCRGIRRLTMPPSTSIYSGAGSRATSDAILQEKKRMRRTCTIMAAPGGAEIGALSVIRSSRQERRKGRRFLPPAVGAGADGAPATTTTVAGARRLPATTTAVAGEHWLPTRMLAAGVDLEIRLRTSAAGAGLGIGLRMSVAGAVQEAMGTPPATAPEQQRFEI